MDRAALVQVFDQLIGGYDIPTPAGMLRLRAETAAQTPGTAPYSLLTNLAHANLWQSLWLKKLAGEPRPPSMEVWANDFREPDPSEWKSLRAAFLDGLAEARRIAASEPFEHRLPTDAEAVETLIRIAVHGAYHCGQMNLLKRMGAARSA